MSLELIRQDDEKMARLCAAITLMNERDAARPQDTRTRVAGYIAEVRRRAWANRSWETILNQQVSSGLMLVSDYVKKLKRLEKDGGFDYGY